MFITPKKLYFQQKGRKNVFFKSIKYVAIFRYSQVGVRNLRPRWLILFSFISNTHSSVDTKSTIVIFNFEQISNIVLVFHCLLSASKLRLGTHTNVVSFVLLDLFTSSNLLISSGGFVFNWNIVLHNDKILYTTFLFKSSKVKQNEAQLRLPKNYL